jgi:hypothetical protein
VSLSESDDIPAWYPSFLRDRTFKLFFGIVLLAVLVVSGTAIGPVVIQGREQRSTSLHAVGGRLSFLSSGQVGNNNNQGIADIVQLQLEWGQDPEPGQQYYAWLLSDPGNAEAPALLLGVVKRQGQSGVVTYSDPRHTDLLATMSRLLVTEQDASVTPISPSTDHRAWRYVASIPETHPTAAAYNRYGLLDHIRHLLVAEPTLQSHSLFGGLVIWLVHNLGRLVEWTIGARNDWQSDDNVDISQMRQQLLRVMLVLDGIASAPADPPGNDLYSGLVESPTDNVGLLPLDSQPEAFSLVTDIDYHLQGVAASPGVSTEQQQECAAVLAVMDHINIWLKQVRLDDLRLIHMSDQQLRQPSALSLLNDMQMNAVWAFSGQIDQASGTSREGAEWVYQASQQLAQMRVTAV